MIMLAQQGKIPTEENIDAAVDKSRPPKLNKAKTLKAFSAMKQLTLNEMKK